MAKLYPSNVINLCNALPSTQSILIRGPHGIGKSQIAKEMGVSRELPVIDLRLSQMTEGDFLGLPKIVETTYEKDGETVLKHGSTEFYPPWWFIKAMNEPCILLLDEINRAVPEVMQCAFQLVLDRSIQGKSIHPGTYIVAAINATMQYQVTEMDPALLDRFLVVDMTPSLKDWKKWAKGMKLDSSIIEFCSQNKDHWWHDPTKSLDPGRVYPSPRAWEMLHNCLKAADLFAEHSKVVFKHIVNGLVGFEAGTAYWTFIKDYDYNITAEDILNDYAVIKDRVVGGLAVEQIMAITDKLCNHCEEKKWTKVQVRNLNSFMTAVENKELVFSLWSRLNGLGTKNKKANDNGILVHKICKDVIFEAVNNGSGAS